MCPRSRHWLAILMIVVCAAMSVAPARADDLEVFLEEHGLRHLLAVRLEQRLADATGQQRADLILQLASIYASELETEPDASLRVELERRSRELLKVAPESSADELRLALLRGPYRRIEKIAENHRLRRAEDDDLASARASLDEIIPELRSLVGRVGDSLEDVQRQLSRSSGNASISISNRARRLSRLLSESRFLTAWALYYKALIEDDPSPAKEAERMFMTLLDPERPFLTPADVSIDLRHLEPIARTILGTALAKSFSSTTESLDWLSLLQHETTFEPIRDQLPIWHLVILLQNGDFARSLEHLRGMVEQFDQAAEASGGVDVRVASTWLRLAAVYALEHQENYDAQQLSKFVFTNLAGLGLIDQIVSLSERYGPESLGPRGFASIYVRGVLAYQQAREMHDSEEPTSEPLVMARYEEAAQHFENALRQPDAQGYEQPQAVCRRLIGMCLYFQGRFIAARDKFIVASEHLAPTEAPQALWMAIVSLDKIVEATDDDDRKAELNALIGQFLEKYPSSEYAPRLVLKRAVTEQEASTDSVAQLLAVPETSEVYESAQSRAAVILYRLFIESDGAQQIDYGNQYLTVALRLLEADERVLGSSSAVDQRYVGRCRRVLEVSLTDGIERLAAARNAIRGFTELRESGAAIVEDYLEEVDYRRMRERLLSGDVLEAQSIAEAIWQRDPNATWARLANRGMFKHAHDTLRNGAIAQQQRGQALATVIRYGGRVLREYDAAADLQNPRVVAYFVAVANAAFELWERTGDPEPGQQALFLYRDKLLGVLPRNARFLRSTAVLAEAFDDVETALRCWRQLVSGTPQGEIAWFEARFKVISILEQSDPDRAREVMDQHVQLYPDYGPNPWGARLRALDDRLPREERGG